MASRDPVMEGEKTRLRPMTLDEVDLVVRWLRDPDVHRFWYGRAIAKEEFLAHWDRHYFDGSEPERGRCFAIEADGCPIGMIAYNAINQQARSVEIDVIVGEKVYWNRGYGTDAIRAFLRHLFEAMDMHRVWLAPSATNARAIRCYEKCGFIREGLLREADWVEGRWGDAVLMAVLEQEFKGG